MLLLLPLLGFLFVALLVAGAAMALAPGPRRRHQQRLGELRGIQRRVAVDEPSPYGESVKRSFKRLGKYAPTSAAEMGKLKGRLVLRRLSRSPKRCRCSSARVSAARCSRSA